ncbi:MAG: HAMP domain-containing protein, partial [Deltaproteobacteria bacterium]|nr:HAMP domain-containing protein [Deltaproteobacteria bacterium]
RLGFNLNPMFDEMKQVTVKALLISAGIFLLGLLVIFGIASRMTSPIEQLTVAAKHIEAGDLRYRVSLKRSDELGSLAAAFDQMAERIMHRERDLKQSQDLIRRADRLSSLGMLTAGLAHEIRNPLVAIRTFTQLLPERYQDPEFRNSFQALALKEVDRICGLINDLLSFARPSTPNVSEENLDEIVDSIVRILETEAKEKEVLIYRRLAAHLPKIFIDKGQIKQVIMNIVMNALQSIEGRGVVEVATRLFTKNGSEQYVQIEFRDSGVGILEKDLEDIFNPFFTTKKDGSGLGLSISHQIVQEHGGYIVVESQVGKGTTFSVNLPVRHLNHQRTEDAPQVHEEDSSR